MAITPSWLAVQEPGTPNKYADTNSMTRNAQLVQREVISLGSPNDATPESILDLFPDNTAYSGAKVPVIGARAFANPPTWGDGNSVPLVTDLAGNLKVARLADVNSGPFTIGPNAVKVFAGLDGVGALGLELENVGSGTVFFEGIEDFVSGTWRSVPAVDRATGAIVTQTTVAGMWVVPYAGLARFRVRTSGVASGCDVTINGGTGASVVFLASPITVNSLPLPANAAQESGGNLSSIASKDFATQTTLAALLGIFAGTTYSPNEPTYIASLRRVMEALLIEMQTANLANLNVEVS